MLYPQNGDHIMRVWFSDAKNLREIPPGSTSAGAPNAGWVGENRRLSTNNWLYLEKKLVSWFKKLSALDDALAS